MIPVWPSSRFWPLLTSQYKPFMKGCFQQNGSEAMLKGYCPSLIKSRMTLVTKRMDVFREMTLVMCSGNCLQECELKHLSVPEGLRWSDLYTYCT